MAGTEISPRGLQEAVDRASKRMKAYRKARVMFIQQFVGSYFGREYGLTGEQALNLTFNAIKTLLPSLVFNFPKHDVTTPFLAYRDYAEMLGLALSQQDRKLNIKDTYRRWVVDAIFALGILKTGLCDSGSVIGFDPDDQVDPGTVYTDLVSLDNFVFDPNARQLENGLFLGDKVTVPRRVLLESGLYRNDIVERLPGAASSPSARDRAEALSMNGLTFRETAELEDEVEVYELWVPRAKALVTVPAAENFSAEDYLRVQDYYGPDTGPYTFLRLTPPVPDNPLPVSMVGIWYDLAQMANRMAAKIMRQAERQKDIIGYKSTAADDAQSALDAEDGEAVRMDDPDGAKVFSFGGQARSNEAHIQQLMQWHNMMANNPEGLAGLSSNAGSATEASILQNNASIGLEDMKDLCYSAAAEEARKRAWYLHTDPLLEVPLIRRVHVPSSVSVDPITGAPVVIPSETREVQVVLTPEARCGDFLDFAFQITPDSMGRRDSKERLAKAMEFAVKILPAAATAAQTCALMGVPFSFPRFAVRMAKEAGIEWMEEVFQDPELQMRMAHLMARGPQPDVSKGVANPNAAILQNGQPGNVASTPGGPDEQFNRAAQEGANEAQAGLPVRPTY